MKEPSKEKKNSFRKTVTLSTGKLTFLLVIIALTTVFLTVLTYQSIRFNIRERKPSFLGGWYLDYSSDLSDETLPYSFDFRGDGVVNIKSSNGDEVTCSYVCSPRNRSLTILNYYGRDISLGYSIQPLIHFWPDSENGWDADYLFAG